MAKIRITIEAEYGPEKDDYNYKFDTDGNRIEITTEQQEKLTVKDFLALDGSYIKNGDFTLNEFLDYVDVDDDSIKLELADDDRPVHHG